MRNYKVFAGILLIAGLLFSGSVLPGQDRPGQDRPGQDMPNLERMEQMRIAFFTEKLDLTKSEAEKFWPIFNDYSSRREKINEDRRILFRYIQRNGDYLSEKEISESLDKYLNLEKEEKEVSVVFNQKFLEILPAKKVLKIYLADHQFKVFILNQIRENRPIRPGQGGRGFRNQ